MKVVMLVGLKGVDIDLEPGDVHDFDDSEATRLICARYALPHVESKVERAVKAAPAEVRAAGVADEQSDAPVEATPAKGRKTKP